MAVLKYLNRNMPISRRIRPVLFAYVIGTLLVPFTVVGGDANKVPADRSMLETAAQLTSLDSAATPPFHFQGHFVLSAQKSKMLSTHGRIDVLFDSQSRWRRDITWDTSTTTEIVTDGQRWVKNLDLYRVDVLRLDRLLHFSKLLIPFPGGSVARGTMRQIQGKAAECLRSSSNGSTSTEVCLDRSSGLPLSLKDNLRNLQLDFGTGRYISAGTQHFPTVIRSTERDGVVVELALDVLESATPSQDAFVPPPDANGLPWCLNERPPQVIRISNAKQSQFSSPGNPTLKIMTLPVQEFSLIVFYIQADGRVKGLSIYDKRGSLLSSGDDTEKFRDSLFEPARCDRRSVEGEFLLWR